MRIYDIHTYYVDQVKILFFAIILDVIKKDMCVKGSYSIEIIF